MRNAWLIIAHNEFEVLQRLVAALDGPESDFFVHIDRKVRQLPVLRVEKGRLFLLAERRDVRWGSVSQIEVELHLLETALAKGPYGHYHLLSGTHMPLQPLGSLNDFYAAHPDEEIVRRWAPDPGDADFKLRRWHFPLRHFKSGSPLQQRLCQLAWRCVIRFQKATGLRHLKNEKFIKTDNWLSVTEKACRFLVGRRDAIVRKYRWSFCGDEYFAATELAAAGGFRLLDCPQLLHVEFQRDTPKTFPLSALPALQATGRLWARKFTSRPTGE